MDVEFKLFGSLTVRQFISLAGGIIIGVFIYLLKLPIVLGWPLILLSVIIGFSLAFVTVNGQAFSRWFGNFLVAIVSSQKYVWKKNAQTPKALTATFKVAKPEDNQQKIKKELGIAPIMEVVKEKNIELDEFEQAELSKLDKYFEREFDKNSLKKAAMYREQADRGPAMVSTQAENLAGNLNPIGKKQAVAKVGPNKKFVYQNMRNRKVHAIKTDPEDVEIEQKIRDILAKQNQLDPYLKTMELEEKEKSLKAEMRKLYQEIQLLKSKNG